MTEMFEYVATCLFGLERLVGEEIEALGYERLETIDGRVTFRGDIHAIARCNLWLRTAEHVYIKLGSFEADSFEALFEGTRALPWERWIGCDDAFPVKGHSISSQLQSIPDCQSIVKKAVVERLRAEYGIEWFSEEGAKYQIEFFILKNHATLMIDTTGVPLYKRGYRTEAGIAPLRETLAAAMVKLSRPLEHVLLWDPFAGSGTIPLEAALLMTNTAPGLRRTFAAEDFLDIPADSFARAREEAQDLIQKTAFEAYASDIDPVMVDIARANVERAGMGDVVKCFCRNGLDVETRGRRGTIVCNPPYGERMMEVREAERLYRHMGRAFSRLENWQLYIICADDDFEYYFGWEADKVRRLYNGMIPCGFYQYFKKERRPSRRPDPQRGRRGFDERPWEQNRQEKSERKDYAPRAYRERSAENEKNASGRRFDRLNAYEQHKNLHAERKFRGKDEKK